jgi:hypothetical protein
MPAPVVNAQTIMRYMLIQLHTYGITYHQEDGSKFVHTAAPGGATPARRASVFRLRSVTAVIFRRPEPRSVAPESDYRAGQQTKGTTDSGIAET